MTRYNFNSIINSSELIKKIEYYEKIPSTNVLAKEILYKGLGKQKDNFLILANYQTQGIGKNGVKFFSPSGVGIYMSIVLLNPNCNVNLYSIVTPLAICKAIKKSINIDVNIKIKWPNDILLNNKKVCGILIEAGALSNVKSLSYVIIGIGINVNNQKFDMSIENIATSLKKEVGKSINRSNLVSEILKQLEYLLSIDSKKLIKDYLKNLDKTSLENTHNDKSFVDLINLGGNNFERGKK